MGSVRKLLVMARRFLTPGFVVTLYCLLRKGVKISPRAEVELSPLLRLARGTVVSSFCKIKAAYGPVIVGPRGGFATGCFVSAGEGGIEIGRNFVCGANVKHRRGELPPRPVGRPPRGPGAYEQGHPHRRQRVDRLRLFGARWRRDRQQHQSSRRTASSRGASPTTSSSRATRPRFIMRRTPPSEPRGRDAPTTPAEEVKHA